MFNLWLTRLLVYIVHPEAIGESHSPSSAQGTVQHHSRCEEPQDTASECN